MTYQNIFEIVVLPIYDMEQSKRAWLFNDIGVFRRVSTE